MPVWREEMAKKKVGAYITLDGEKEFRSAVTQCNKSLSTMKSEMKLVEAETAGKEMQTRLIHCVRRMRS